MEPLRTSNHWGGRRAGKSLADTKRIIVTPFHVRSAALASIVLASSPRRRRGHNEVKGAAMAFCSCFGPSKAERREADRAESEEARAKATEAAQRRQLLYLNLPPLPPSFSRSKLRRQTVLYILGPWLMMAFFWLDCPWRVCVRVAFDWG